VKTWDERDDMEYRPLTLGDKVAGLALLWSFGVLCGVMLSIWIHRG
jgi:hypothetical protein